MTFERDFRIEALLEEAQTLNAPASFITSTKCSFGVGENLSSPIKQSTSFDSESAPVSDKVDNEGVVAPEAAFDAVTSEVEVADVLPTPPGVVVFSPAKLEVTPLVRVSLLPDTFPVPSVLFLRSQPTMNKLTKSQPAHRDFATICPKLFFVMISSTTKLKSVPREKSPTKKRSL